MHTILGEGQFGLVDGHDTAPQEHTASVPHCLVQSSARSTRQLQIYAGLR